MSEKAIELYNVRKVFRLYPDLVRSRIKQFFLPWKKFYQPKTALEKINLTINRGEIVGIIGPNGAGKTTLLKLIAGISFPTSGKISVRGKVVAVLALGLGFHPRLTGLQNIYLAGMMLGMSRAEILEKRDWIIQFSELDNYINYPLTSYSTGMRARLSFAVAACQEPEILIIDEALATGDIRFVQKCIDRIHEITKSGTTALFVSHNIWSIKRLTNRCILISDGQIIEDGDTGLVADKYYEAMLKNEVFEPQKNTEDGKKFVGNGKIQLISITLKNADGDTTNILNSGTKVTIELKVKALAATKGVGFFIGFNRNDGITVTSIGSLAGGVLNEKNEFRNESYDLPKGVSSVFIVLDPVLLAPGDYSIDMQIFDSATHSGYTNNEQFYFKPRVKEFGVRRLGNINRGVVYYQPAKIKINKAEI